MLLDLRSLAHHTILGPRPDIFLNAIPSETGSNQVGCRTTARMREIVEEVEDLFTNGEWHYWARATGFCIADQITGTIGDGQFLEMGGGG